jgi:hypothetical protein
MRIMDAKPEAFVAQLRCDRCGVEAQYNVNDGFNNFVQIGFDAAWGSDLPSRLSQQFSQTWKSAFFATSRPSHA